MERRDFLKLAGLAGVSVLPPRLGRAHVDAARQGLQTANDAWPLVVMVQATGGWDPTLLCDPKPNLNQSYDEGDILTAGNIAYVPVGSSDAFFQSHYQRMLVLNGVDVQTNSHDAGRRHMVSGRLGEGHPNLAAVVAGNAAAHLPMAFLTFGGYDRTSGLVAPTRNLGQDRLAELAHPERLSAADENSATYHSPAGRAVIRMARQARAERQRARQRLPRYEQSLGNLMTARLGSDELQHLEAVLPPPHTNEAFRQIELVVAAYRAGICAAANLEMGGFDTHDDHDNRHRARMSELVDRLVFLWDEAERQGIADRLVVVVASDFGRTPHYNSNAGKDHWSISSMIVMGAGIEGNRVVGLTDEGHNPIPLDPITLQSAANPDAGVRILPAHVHRNLRRVLGLEGTDLDAMFPLPVEEELALF